MPDYAFETRTFVGEPATWPGYGYAGYVVGGVYQVSVLRLADGNVEVTSTSPATRRVFVSEQLFERWWKPVTRGGGDGNDGGRV